MAPLCLPIPKTALHMSPINSGVFSSAAGTGEAQTLHLKAQAWPCGCLQGALSRPGSGGRSEGSGGELEVRGQVTFVPQGGALGLRLWVAST